MGGGIYDPHGLSRQKRKLYLWHDISELKSGYNGVAIIFLCKLNSKFYEASYMGYNDENNMPVFQCMGLRVNIDDILMWCERMDMFTKTNMEEILKSKN